MVRRIGTRRHLIEVAQQIGRVFIDAQCPASLEFLAAVAPREQPHPERKAPRRRQHTTYAVADADRTLDRPDRNSVVSGRSVTVRVDIGGRRTLKKKTT